jgi:hypothetical protein
MSYNEQTPINNLRMSLDKTGLSNLCKSPRLKLYCFSGLHLEDSQAVEGKHRFQKNILEVKNRLSLVL